MDFFDKLIEVLEESIKKHGSITLTTGHLLNILKMAHRFAEEESNDQWIAMSDDD